MLMIISPSKTQDFDGNRYAQYTIPANLERSEVLVNQLRQFKAEEIGELMKISSKLATLNHERYQAFQPPFDLNNAKQALLAFKGDVYNGIDIKNYTDENFEFAQKHLRILSGLYGVLKPLDLIQPYRLEMGTRLSTNAGKNLYDFWDTQVTDTLNQDLESDFDANPTLVNLASNEYYKAVKPQYLKAKVLNIAFKENKGGTYKVIGIHAKRARGLMVDFAIKNCLSDAKALQAFDSEGYQFSPDLSQDSEWVFCR